VNTKIDQEIIQRFIVARRDQRLVVLEGIHALKHAHRFGAVIREVVSADPEAVKNLAKDLAPDLLPVLGKNLQAVSASEFKQLTPAPPATGVVAIAERTYPDPEMLLRSRARPIVLLDNPRNYGNIGAVIRVSAAAGAGGVVVVGDHDPWHPEAVRGGAGLQFALPVLQIAELPKFNAPLIAVDAEGEPFETVNLPADAVLAFGSERSGLSKSVRDQATRMVRIPMVEGVSSLNLATSVAVMLYTKYNKQHE
jgi:RNA methyltransferase, TrmH family